MSTCTAIATATTPCRWAPREEGPRRTTAEAPLGRAIALLDRGRSVAADQLLTAALLEDGRNADLWMAAGVARLRRGALGAARSAFEMCAWLSDDPVAREIAAMLGDHPQAHASR
jgi:hypothetical protein